MRVQELSSSSENFSIIHRLQQILPPLFSETQKSHFYHVFDSLGAAANEAVWKRRECHATARLSNAGTCGNLLAGAELGCWSAIENYSFTVHINEIFAYAKFKLLPSRYSENSWSASIIWTYSVSQIFLFFSAVSVVYMSSVMIWSCILKAQEKTDKSVICLN